MGNQLVGLKGTPFHSRTEAATSTAEWYRWGDYVVVDVYDGVRQELAAMREQATVNEMSPLWKLAITGADSLKLINDVVTRDISGQEVGQIIYTPWCNQEGKVVGDGLILREEEDSFILVAGPNGEWFRSFSSGLEVDVVDVRTRSESWQCKVRGLKRYLKVRPELHFLTCRFLGLELVNWVESRSA